MGACLFRRVWGVFNQKSGITTKCSRCPDVAFYWGYGSNLELNITKDDDSYNVVLFDDKRRSPCGEDKNGESIYAYKGTGIGQVDGGTLSVELSFWCLTTPQSFLRTWDTKFIYDTSNDTLVDIFGEGVPSSTWHRR